MAPADPHRPPGRLPSQHTLPHERTAWRLGFGVSVLLHALLLVVYGGISGPPTVSVSPGGEGGSEMEGLELLNLIAQAEEDAERPDEPEEEELERLPIPVAPVTEAQARDPEPGDPRGEPAEDPGPLGPTAAERLRVRVGDARLWAPLSDRDLGEITMEQFMESDLAWRLGLWQDSMAAEIRRQENALDWTYTDEDGNRWGVSPGRLHLGSVTLPLPFGFGINPGRYDEWREREYIDGEIARGAAESAIFESRRERAEAIRRRRDRERAEELEELRRSGPRRARPDTTGGGGNR